MTKFMAHILCLEYQLYSFGIVEKKSIREKLIKFYKIIDDFKNIEVKINDVENNGEDLSVSRGRNVSRGDQKGERSRSKLLH